MTRVRDAGFPTVEQLRQGIVLCCITHSFWLAARKPLLGKTCWHDGTYFEDTGECESWAVAFTEGAAVAVFFSSESNRNPFPVGSSPYDQSRYFRGMPGRLNRARERALSLMTDGDDRTGNPSEAVITAAMWADGDQFTAAEPWADTYDHSWAFHRYLLPPEVALRKWWCGMALPGSGERAAWSLYERRLAATDAVIAVEPWEWRSFMEAAGREPEPAKLSAAQDLLAGVGIALQPSPGSPHGGTSR